MGKQYFMTMNMIKDNTLIDSNVSEQTLKVIQRTAEYTYLQEVLGTSLYKELTAKFKTNTLTAIERILIEEYILEYLYSLMDMLVVDDLLFKFSDNGVNSPTPDNTTQIQEAQIQQQRTHKERAVNFNFGLLVKYLGDNCDSFPKYNNVDEGVPAKKINTYSIFCDDDDYYLDNEYNSRNSNSEYSEGI